MKFILILNIVFEKKICKNGLNNCFLYLLMASRSANGRVGCGLFSPSPLISGSFNLGSGVGIYEAEFLAIYSTRSKNM